MLKYNELIELRDKLVNCEISLEIAKAQFWNDFKEGQRSWHTKDWKERRKQFIKDCCEECGNKERLTLQHSFHPALYIEYRNEVIRNIKKKDFIDKNILINYIQEKYTYNPVAICPQCNIWNPNERVKKLPKYLCTNCKYEFNEPIYKSIKEVVEMQYSGILSTFLDIKCFITNDGWRNKHNINNILYWLKRNIAKEENSEFIERTTFFNYLDDNIRYLSFNDTKTLCNKCAYNYDINRKELCPNCKTNYKGLRYETCVRCLPEDRRKQVEELLAFYKEMAEGFGELGID